MHAGAPACFTMVRRLARRRSIGAGSTIKTLARRLH